MADWGLRKALGDALEQHVAEELTMRGWEVNPWGQGVLDRKTRQSLKRTDSSLRWTPDLLVSRDHSTLLIDCKGSMSSQQTGRHAIERAAVRAHLQLVAWADIPLYYVFDNLGVQTPSDVLAAGRVGPHTRLGSGAPYLLVPEGLDRPFDDVFGSYSEQGAWQLRLAA